MEVLYMPSPARSASHNQITSIHYEDSDMIEVDRHYSNPKLHTLSHSVSHPGHMSEDSLTQPPKKKKSTNKILSGLSKFRIRLSQSLNKLASQSGEDVRTVGDKKTRSRNRSDNSHTMSSALKKTPSVPQSYSAEVFQESTTPTNHVSFNIDSVNCLSDSRLHEDKNAVSFDTTVKRHYSTGDMLGAQDDLNPRRPCSDGGFNNSNLYKCGSSDIHRFKRFSFGFNTQFGRASAYDKQEPLGEGSYATVYKGISRLTHQIVALKEHRLQEDEGAPFTAIREASLLRELRHANIVTLHDIVHEQTTLTFVFEFVESDLNQYNERHPGGLHSHNVKIFLFQLLRGLAFCHKKRILHRDLKPQNLLISEQGELKLADFGLARAKSVPSKTYSNEVVTLWYRPPDVLLGSTEYNSSLDMWGVGCIFLEMLTGTAAFPGMKDTNDQLDKIWRVLGTPDPVSWPGIEQLSNYYPETYNQYSPRDLSNVFIRLGQINGSTHLTSHLLALMPEKRLSAEESMRHKYFSDLPESVHHLKPDQSVIAVRGCEVVPEMFKKKSSIKTAPRIPHSKSAHAGIS